MKRVQLLLALFVVTCTAAIILYADSGPVTVETTVVPKIVPKTHPPSAATAPAIVPALPDVDQKRLPGIPALSQQTPLASSIVKPPASSPAASSRNYSDPATDIEFVPVPGGCFQMGDSTGDADEKPVHQVCLDNFFIGRFEITQKQWAQIMGNYPSFFSSCGENCPAESVSWNDVQEFIKAFSKLNGITCRLPTEAEWEYACRSGGKNERFCGGDDVDTAAWYDRNSGSKPHATGEKQPNGLGIFDMSGNVWEWVSDIYGKDYYSSTSSHNPEGPTSGVKRVIRGGSWYNDHRNVRASLRGSDDPDHRSINLGFRLAFSTR